ncbi:hypothetical protein ARMGADRAFT_999155 [Armillaria gallica]|uniref:Uncharacterized protein n=1 Tax=Armillaria gallica TaxID=47427 RepID=A0A2H3D4C8_ARMGA|nr:hypothetical protein ARMGADRAFT_999155 [Armillaria gallica]
MFRVDFAWVRWYGFDSGHHSGFTAKRPHHVGFVDGNDSGAFGFLDPDDIIQAVHLIPVYRLGQTAEFLPPSFARRPEENNQDYERYSVDMYVIFCFFSNAVVNLWSEGGTNCGLGVGHRSTWDATRLFREDLCKAYNLPHDLFGTGEDVEMSSEDNSDGEGAEEDEDNEDLSPEMTDEAEADGDQCEDDEEEDSDADDDEEWETDEEAEDEDAVDADLDNDAEAELDDICDDDDNKMGLELDLGFAAL